MSKKLLFQFDTDAAPSVFDVVVGYDGGADHITGYANVTPENVGAYVDGTIYTRGGKEKQSTAIFVGGGDMAAGEKVFEAVKKRFFGPFRVSSMLDSNGSNTTAAAGVALVVKAAGGSVKGKKAVVLAGTGPVGMRSAALLAGEGAEVVLCGRKLDKAQAAADAVNKRFNVSVTAAETPDDASRSEIVKGAHLVFAAGAIGLELVPAAAWQNESSIEIVADYNAQPPLGIGAIEATDKGKDYSGKLAFGALGIGGLKLKLHRTCIGKLFESSDKVFDAEEIYALAKELA
ncbi:NADP-dependent methylenetetrahydromethanopterin/methylenetetrahydrofolate dehydrogenase [Methylobacterium haplocladii]|uniref:MtdA bifunctional protein n=1 Tax=Methylobacterium haplocladii TaxID=1176176 RepID=A0A512IKB8_9HYPH|nr:NADP-dependent methylenetetrahydromethanopterin/methylenetetrahydrofolate dehydrogenase [Methylobacterium haplocladii]GEO98167.1 MtdA bifunctional protein [Methylobacterium haplocladii]GJD83586.1 Bifunctional protein MdtA [Methylobacterium haplocladii]GLS58603.1 MtdA bifunctional protein [Methylobacterium haplocladii]